MKLGLALEQLAAGECALADELIAVGERHRSDHEVFHLTRTLARIEAGHVDALQEHASRYAAEVGNGRSERGAELPARGPESGRRPEPGLLLLRDLRHLHVLAAGTSLDWVALGQGAQAARDIDLLEAVSVCHGETLRTLKWTTYRLKEAAPQALTS